jgi:HD superfamily phosphodiesterase
MDIVKDAINYALSEIEKYGTPIPVHFEIARDKALELANKLGGDQMVVTLGATLMDLKLGQAIKEDRLKDHVSMGVEASRLFLNNYSLDKKIKEKILNCIESHHRDVEFNSIEAEICANADCYRFIHPRGFLAYFTLLGKRYDNFDDCLRQAEMKLDEKNQILSLDICKEELNGYYKVLKQLIADSKL